MIYVFMDAFSSFQSDTPAFHWRICRSNQWEYLGERWGGGGGEEEQWNKGWNGIYWGYFCTVFQHHNFRNKILRLFAGIFHLWMTWLSYRRCLHPVGIALFSLLLIIIIRISSCTLLMRRHTFFVIIKAECDGVMGVCYIGLRSFSNASTFIYVPILSALVVALIIAACIFFRRRCECCLSLTGWTSVYLDLL